MHLKVPGWAHRCFKMQMFRVTESGCNMHDSRGKQRTLRERVEFLSVEIKNTLGLGFRVLGPNVSFLESKEPWLAGTVDVGAQPWSDSHV